MDRNTVHEVLEYGPIVYKNADLDILITANGAYLNFWCGDFDGGYTNTDCRYWGEPFDFDKMERRAREWAFEVLNEEWYELDLDERVQRCQSWSIPVFAARRDDPADLLDDYPELAETV